MRPFAFATCSLVLFGCAPQDVSTPIASLAAPVAIAAIDATAASDSALDFGVTDRSGDASATMRSAIRSASVALTTGPRPHMNLLTLPLDDMDVSASAMPPAGLALRQLQLELRTSAVAAASQASQDALRLEATATVALDWAMLLDDGSMYRPGPSDMPALPVTIAVDRDAEGAVTMTIDARCDGVCWQLQDVATMHDARLHASIPVIVWAVE